MLLEKVEMSCSVACCATSEMNSYVIIMHGLILIETKWNINVCN